MKARGLVPGLIIQLEVRVGDRVETYSTRVEDVTEEQFAVLVPMRGHQHRPVPAGTGLRIRYGHGNQPLTFVTTSLGASPDGELLFLAPPRHIEHSDRRSAFRLPMALPLIALYRMVIDGQSEEPVDLKATIVDLSEGGACLSTRNPIALHEWLGIEFELPGGGPLRARLRVVGVESPGFGRVNLRVHCMFADIRLSDRDRIARYLMRRQIELRRRGQL
ncbi:MAG: flagellar brake protein [Dehalococcoidia bacterium]|nr:flagellar brake protein [Dehalococcoidia bacterium]